ncbi:MAG: DUF1972 domain-containing protein [Limimaricola soesokkakensis]|uniref:DUF1972 domain-containing protein n=1 Tax=Limimaricola soesokkakensis TaxID=1343159 RepID=UPI004058EA11
MAIRDRPKSSGKSIAVIGTMGVPASYGGFETLAQNLVENHAQNSRSSELTVYCSTLAYESRPQALLNARLIYVPLNANGAQSIFYDIISLFDAVRRRTDVLLVLGVSGALAFPIIRAISSARIVTNVDGIEWRREKWRGLAKVILRWSEAAAARWSHTVIADNDAIADHLKSTYGCSCQVIAYGGDHATSYVGNSPPADNLPKDFALALCRIEPENNVHTILDGWQGLDMPLVFVGNWGNSPYGRELKERYASSSKLHLLDPIYDPARLHALRSSASIYVHGHSAGGTNPSLVEMMHFGTPVIAYDCIFNRNSTENKALYFISPNELRSRVQSITADETARISEDMLEIAGRRYTWNSIGKKYFELLEGD